MVKFLIGVVTGIILVFLILFIGIFAVARMREKPPTVADGSTLMLELDGEIPERAPVEFPIPFLQQRTPPTVADVWTTLRKAAVDRHIRAIVFEPRDLQIGDQLAYPFHPRIGCGIWMADEKRGYAMIPVQRGIAGFAFAQSAKVRCHDVRQQGCANRAVRRGETAANRPGKPMYRSQTRIC